METGASITAKELLTTFSIMPFAEAVKVNEGPTKSKARASKILSPKTACWLTTLFVVKFAVVFI